MKPDMCVPCGDGLINIRAGAIIEKNGKYLMVGNKRSDYLYSVGGRLKFGETAEEAIVREVLEETGVQMRVKRLAFVHENYFCGDSPSNLGIPIYELSFYFIMDVPQDFEPVSKSFTEDQCEEQLFWVEPDTPIKYYPEFLRDELPIRFNGVKHYATNDIPKQRKESI